MLAKFLTLVGALLTLWLFTWRRWGDRWGWLGLLNAWAEWGRLLSWALAVVALSRQQWGVGVALVMANFTPRPPLHFGEGEQGQAGFAPCPLPFAPGADAITTPFSLFTANLYKRNPSLAPHLALIERTQPDVICLQEFTPVFCTELLAFIGDDYPYRALRPEQSSFGFGVVSRLPLEETGRYLTPGVHPWAQRVRVTLPTGREIEIYNVHLLPPTAISTLQQGLTRSFRNREAQLYVMHRAITERGLPALVAGDCNFADSADAYRIATGYWGDAWAAVGRGLRWTWPMLAFPNKQFRWNPRLLRIDYCFHTHHFTPHAMHVLSERTGSDHCPLFINFFVREEGYPSSRTSQQTHA